jgi:hypothetical protein
LSKDEFQPGLPDGLFSYQTPNLGLHILESLGIEKFSIFYDHLEHITTISYFYDNLVYFMVVWCIFPLWYVWTKKNLANPMSANVGQSYCLERCNPVEKYGSIDRLLQIRKRLIIWNKKGVFCPGPAALSSGIVYACYRGSWDW